LDADLSLPGRNPRVAVTLEARDHSSAVEHAARLTEEFLSSFGGDELQPVNAGLDAEACARPGLLDCLLDVRAGRYRDRVWRTAGLRCFRDGAGVGRLTACRQT